MPDKPHLEAREEFVRVLVLPDVDGLAIVVAEGVPKAARVEGRGASQGQVRKHGLCVHTCMRARGWVGAWMHMCACVCAVGVDVHCVNQQAGVHTPCNETRLSLITRSPPIT